MDNWQLILYGAASLLALRALGSLMLNHKRIYKQQLLVAEEQKRRAERAKAEKTAKQTATPPKRSNGAAA